MATLNTQYLQFNAYSIKELIVRKLTEDTKFTDQVYEGSNLNVLIDLVSYMYLCLTYCLNNAAAESMFADTQVYENMNRLVKFLGYNPKGIVPASGTFYVDNTSAKYSDQYIQKYSSIDTGITDEKGFRVYYSTIDDIHIDSSGSNEMFKFKMYNGIWKLYPTVFTSSGSEYELFDLDMIGSDLENATSIDKQVADGGVHVYVEHFEYDADGNKTSTISLYAVVDQELFTNNDYNLSITSYARIFNGNDKVVNVRLNEKKCYTVKFGNGIVGKKLSEGDLVYVMYLATNGDSAALNYDSFTTKPLVHNSSVFGMTSDMYKMVFTNSGYAVVSESNDNDVQVGIVTSTSPSAPEESVDDIRRAAPEWFKIGLRLVTASDYEYYIKNLRKGEVLDAVCLNNYEYASTFYKWLFDLGVTKHNDRTYYLNRDTLFKSSFLWADPVDVNNVYIWLKMAGEASIESLRRQYIDDMLKIKCLTSNIVLQDVIDMNFSVTAMPYDVIVKKLADGTYANDTTSYIEVTMDNSTAYATGVVADLIENIIKSYFTTDNVSIGKPVNYNDMLEDIYNINGIVKVRTVYIEGTDVTKQHTYEGLAFATWSDRVIDIGDDLQISNSIRTLEKFLYPKYFDSSLKSRIKVIKKSINSGARVQY